MTSNAALSLDKLSDEDVRAQVQEAFHLSLCYWQIRAIRAVCLAQSSRRDVCLISATGSGKTITFLAPLLFAPMGLMVIITPLNLLGEQIAAQLKGFGISAVALSAATSTSKVFQDIRSMKYRVVVTNVEIAKRPRGEFDKLWRDRKWTSRLICIVWDEAHCVSKWADFRAEYKDAGRIRRMLPDHVPFYLVSATLPPAVLTDVYHNLGMRASAVDVFHRSNDRPNIHLVVRRMLHPLGSFRDLDFIVTDNGRVPLKFVIFFDSIQESVDAVDYLRTRLRPEDRHRIKWFNSHMTTQFRDDEMDNLASGETWGLACTDSFGLGIDRVRNIELAVQHRVRHVDICKLVQRYGRAMRSNLHTATAVILAEAKYYDEEKAEREEKKRKRAADEVEKENKKRKVAVSDPDMCETVPAVDETSASPASSASTSVKGAMGAAERVAMLEGRRAVYSAHGVHDAPKKKGRVEKDVPTIDPALDDMVNAAGRGFGCYRLPAQVFFGNDKIEPDHMLCKPDALEGCTRCAFTPSPICCALCSPDHFVGIADASSERRVAAEQSSRAGAKKSYVYGTADYALCDALHSWRKEKTTSLHGELWLQQYGPSFYMSDSTLTCIVDQAHHRRLHNSADLVQHCKWGNAAAYGEEIIAQIRLIHGDQAASSATAARRPPTAPKRPYTCGICRQPGHKGCFCACLLLTLNY